MQSGDPYSSANSRLLVVAAAIASLVHRLAEQPGRPQRVVQRNHRRAAGRHVQQVEQRLRQVVRLRRDSPGTQTIGMSAVDFQSQPR